MTTTERFNFDLYEKIQQKIDELLQLVESDKTTQEGDLIAQMIYTSLKLLQDDIDRGQLKLMVRSFKEMRYAYHVFKKHRFEKCVSIFGSARTPTDAPDYVAAKEFSSIMASHGWTCMTGAAEGIMKAGLEGAPKESSFGLSIRLPFENTSHSLLIGDPKLISFRYFFTRKLMFLSHSHAIVAFPGGVGTQDELFEALTLMQTGRSNIVPIVLLEGVGGNYWNAWEHYIKMSLLANGFISEEDLHLYYRAPNVESGAKHIEQFYRRYHSYRYVKEFLVIRLIKKLTQEQLAILNQNFKLLAKEGEIVETLPFEEETDHLTLPRIAFLHTHKNFGLLRAMIDQINCFE